MEIALVEQDGFRLAAGRIQHEIGAVAALRLSGAVNQRLLAAADTQIDILGA